MASREQSQEAPTYGGTKRKLIRGGIAVVVLVAIGVGVIVLRGDALRRASLFAALG